MVSKKNWLASHIHWGFYSALVILVLMIGLTVSSNSRFKLMQSWVKDADAKLEKLRNAQNAIEVIHSKKRSQSKDFASAFTEKQKVITRQLREFTESVSTNPLQLRRINSLTSKVENTLKGMSPQAAGLIPYELDLEQIRSEFGDIEDVELAILNEKVRQARASSEQGYIFSLAGIGFSFLIVLIATLIVVSDRKALHLAKESALEASQAKSDFLSNISHEIRTPLNSIIGMADILAETPLSDDQARYVRVFRNAGKTLLNLINDVLDLSKIEAGRFDLNDAPFRLADLVAGVADLMTFRASSRGLRLRHEIEPGIPDYLLGDCDRLRQILTNLTGNGVKFTQKGEIILRVSRSTESPAEHLEFSVTDTGIGIPEEKKDSVFGKFNQLDRSVSKKYGGTGLGLAISKQLVELMGGKIDLESKMGQGSRFYFVIPLRAATGVIEHATKIRLQDQAPLRILAADDNEDNRFILQAFFNGTPHQVELVDDGSVALEKLKNGTYDVALMDMHMPEMDGLEATRALREWEIKTGKPRTLVFALTANAFREDREKCRAAGCDLHLIKPITKETLFSVLAQHVRPRENRPQPPQKAVSLSTSETVDLSDLVPKYLENRRKDLLTAKQAIDSKDFKKLRTIGHNVKGTARTYGFPALSEIGAQLEAAALAGNLNSVQQCLDALESEVKLADTKSVKVA